MSHIYIMPTPIMIPAFRTSSNQLNRSELINSDADSIFLLALAQSFPGTPITPTTSSSFGSSTFGFAPQHALPRPGLCSLFADQEETPHRGASVWPRGFGYEEYEEDERRNKSYVANTPSRSSSDSYQRGQVVEIHHGTARVTAWVKKAVKKITPKRWRRSEDEPRSRMTLD
ncbi:hypothetical protein FRC01_010000 [Tulasnella sp. 417]|nr:hypothetical protein FRC01_010000 [Tulasnella sp. 417]